jgi:Tol biopolymer transport system component
VQVTREPGGQAGWSGIAEMPDGRIVYGVYTADGRRIRICDPDGRNATNLTSGTNDSYPAVSRDGSLVAYQRVDKGARTIWIREMATGAERRLTTGGFEGAPQFSSDGRWVYYTDWKRFSVARVATTGGPPAVMTGKFGCNGQDFSPDGRHFAAWCASSDDDHGDLHVFDADGTSPRRVRTNITPRWGMVRWSGDGKDLLFIREIAGIQNVWKVPSAGGAPSPATAFDSGLTTHIEISRDGRHLLLSRGTSERQLVRIRGLTTQH